MLVPRQLKNMTLISSSIIVNMLILKQKVSPLFRIESVFATGDCSDFLLPKGYCVVVVAVVVLFR